MAKNFLQIVILLAGICGSSNLLAQEAVTSIDFYGIRKLSVQEIETSIGIASGKLTRLKSSEIKELLKAMDGVEDADVVQIQYPGNLALFIGIRETGQGEAELRAAPTGAIRLEPELIKSYDAVMEMLVPAIKAGKAGEDRSAGHSLSEYPPMREKQVQLISIANERFSSLAKVLRDSSDEKSRAAAAYILAFANDKKTVVGELQLACNDASSLVRNNAVRALGVLATFAQTNDEKKLEISYQPFLQLLKSLTWTDRNKGSALIDSLSVGRDQSLFKTLKEEYLNELEEMARWKSSGHALFSIRILARMAGIGEEEIRSRSRAAKNHNDRKQWVNELLARIAKGLD